MISDDYSDKKFTGKTKLKIKGSKNLCLSITPVNGIIDKLHSS